MSQTPHRNRAALLLCSIVVLAWTSTSPAQPAKPGAQPASPTAEPSRPPTPFDQGRVRVSVGLGAGGTTDNRYFVLGGGVGYFVVDGLEVGVGVDAWLGGTPGITKLTPSLRYYLHFVPTVQPYLGAFYRHWFVGDDFPDVDSVGGDVGLVTQLGGGAFVGGGVAFERIVSTCVDDCWDIYPELILSFSF